MNASMVKRIGHDATGKKCFKAIFGFDKQCSWCNSEAIRKGEAYSLSIVSPKDNHSFDISSCPIINDDGSVSMLNVFRDVTKIKNMEQQLHQAQKMEAIGILAGGIAHDFNNILFPIMGYTQMLIEDVPEDSSLRSSLDKIFTGSMRAKDLVQQILTFSRQENGELKPIKMQPIIKEALKLIRSSIPTTIEIKQNIKTSCGAIEADSTQIHQILMNLTTNAYHAMEKTGGELKVSLGEVELGKFDLIYPDMKPGTYACLTVSDTGVGMDKNLTTKIFNPFFTTKEKGKGTGMGLSVVHGIAKKAGGYIHVYSEPGKGTEFHVYLPVIKSSSEKYQTQTKEIIQGGTEQILLVDDENAILTMEKQMLERLGYHVTARVSSIEALECFRTNSDKFDLVITDMAMPDMSGDKLSAELIKVRPDIPILLCTGFSAILSEEDAASVGIKGFLMKPILMKDLSQKIYEMMNKKDIGMLAN
jgi:signal transduction histidine kinase/ActR/RegA family two-component response regulator